MRMRFGSTGCARRPPLASRHSNARAMTWARPTRRPPPSAIAVAIGGAAQYRFHRIEHGVDAEFRSRAFACGPREPRAQRRLVEQALDPGGERDRILLGDDDG